ncbi:Plasminogen receptor [Eumeta japonica]|uniref:Plasminogen receptor n=1 Tax=Eumeta variegata TaxID=151549 RepID=A0A4C1X0Z6_EUMVA|nr:Plasminogen receptor [Eumeta japonica]
MSKRLERTAQESATNVLCLRVSDLCPVAPTWPRRDKIRRAVVRRGVCSDVLFPMERQMHLQQQLRESQMAMQIAGNREFCIWFCTFYVTVAAGIFSGYRKTKKPYLIAPLVPLTFVTLYYLDLAYGNKLRRIRVEAENILVHEKDLLNLPSHPSALVDVSSSGVEEKKN